MSWKARHQVEAAYKITQLKAQLEAIKGVPRDENAVYQKGKRIGEAAGVRIDASSKSLVFDRLTLGANLDQTSNIESKFGLGQRQTAKTVSLLEHPLQHSTKIFSFFLLVKCYALSRA